MKSVTVRGAGLREGDIAAALGEMASAYESISLGSYPWFRNVQDHGVALVARGTDEAVLESIAAKLAALIETQGAIPERIEGEDGGNSGSPRPGVD